jgi:hypothetical protein
MKPQILNLSSGIKNTIKFMPIDSICTLASMKNNLWLFSTTRTLLQLLRGR